MEHSGLNIIDLAVFATILISGLLALWRGFVREMLALAAWAGAGIVTAAFYHPLQPWMHHHIKNEVTADAATALSLFCGLLLLFIPIGYFVGGLIRGRALTAVDRSLGFVFGLARGAVVVCLLFLITLWVWPEKKKEPDMLAQARTRALMSVGADMMKSFLPQDDMKKLTDETNALEKKADQISLDQQPNPAAATTTNSITAVDEIKKDVIKHLIDTATSQGKP